MEVARESPARPVSTGSGAGSGAEAATRTQGAVMGSAPCTACRCYSRMPARTPLERDHERRGDILCLRIWSRGTQTL